jgi:hypothetical protein
VTNLLSSAQSPLLFHDLTLWCLLPRRSSCSREAWWWVREGQAR